VVPVPRLLPDLLGGKVVLEKSKKPSLLLVGDVDYESGKDWDRATNGNPNGITGTKKRTWAPLPGARAEMEGLASLYQKRFGKESLAVLRGADATEEALRRHSSPRWLHLATHGFCVLELPKAAVETGWDLKFFAEYGMMHLHPGLQSGLVLAGANQAFKSGQDDGILTALEVAELDLRTTEMAVLSACDTGMGRIGGGEGLLGLQRAFHIAGAKTVVASLWQVHDVATRVLMERFYSNLWNKNLSKLEALREAQLWMLREGRTYPGLKRGADRDDEPGTVQNGRLPPYYWAAFVLSGDWR